MVEIVRPDGKRASDWQNNLSHLRFFSKYLKSVTSDPFVMRIRRYWHSSKIPNTENTKITAFQTIIIELENNSPGNFLKN